MCPPRIYTGGSHPIEQKFRRNKLYEMLLTEQIPNLAKNNKSSVRRFSMLYTDADRYLEHGKLCNRHFFDQKCPFADVSKQSFHDVISTSRN
jgi:hypothetical protein